MKDLQLREIWSVFFFVARENNVSINGHQKGGCTLASYKRLYTAKIQTIHTVSQTKRGRADLLVIPKKSLDDFLLSIQEEFRRPRGIWRKNLPQIGDLIKNSHQRKAYSAIKSKDHFNVNNIEHQTEAASPNTKVLEIS